MTKKLSIKDIARIAEVSVSTVSRSLGDSPLISQKTKDRINAIAQEHNFSINTRARNFRTQKSHIIGLLSNMNHAEKQETSDQFLFSLTNSIAANLLVHKYDLLLHTTREITAKNAAEYIHNRRVDGLIIFGQGHNQHKEITKLSEMDVPFVVWGGHVGNSYTTVGGNNFQGAYTATEHLIKKQNKKKIMFLGVPKHLEIQQRFDGFQKALDENGLSIACNLTDKTAFCVDSGYAAVQRLIDADVDFDGLVCASDTIALGAINCLKKHDISIPSQVAVTGFDDISIAKDWSPSLTTIHQDVEQGGKLLVDKILAKIDGENVDSKQLDVDLIRRESA